VLRGDGAGGTIDAENQRRVLRIQDNEVTLAANLTLKNGRAVADTADKTADDNMGGGVYLHRGILNMTGGAIEGCEAGLGSAVCIVNWNSQGFIGTFNMSGGEILGCRNSRKSSGGTVFVDTDQAMTLSGTARIHDNGADGNTEAGGGVYINSGALAMSGGEISNNRAYGKGGGVIARLKSVFTMTGGAITNNTAPAGGGVAYAANTFTKSGAASVTGNTGGDELQIQY
jgi:hypothetical protein